MKRLIVYSSEDYVYMEQLVYEAKKDIEILETINEIQGDERSLRYIKELSNKLNILYKTITYDEED